MKNVQITEYANLAYVDLELHDLDLDPRSYDFNHILSLSMLCYAHFIRGNYKQAMEEDTIWLIPYDLGSRSRSCSSRSKYAKFAYSVIYTFIMYFVDEEGKVHPI